MYAQMLVVNGSEKQPIKADRTPENSEFLLLRALTATMMVRIAPPVLSRSYFEFWNEMLNLFRYV